MSASLFCTRYPALFLGAYRALHFCSDTINALIYQCKAIHRSGMTTKDCHAGKCDTLSTDVIIKSSRASHELHYSKVLYEYELLLKSSENLFHLGNHELKYF